MRLDEHKSITFNSIRDLLGVSNTINKIYIGPWVAINDRVVSDYKNNCNFSFLSQKKYLLICLAYIINDHNYDAGCNDSLYLSRKHLTCECLIGALKDIVSQKEMTLLKNTLLYIDNDYQLARHCILCGEWLRPDQNKNTQSVCYKHLL